jgi:hypothetical protein
MLCPPCKNNVPGAAVVWIEVEACAAALTSKQEPAILITSIKSTIVDAWLKSVMGKYLGHDHAVFYKGHRTWIQRVYTDKFRSKMLVLSVRS